MPLIGYASRTGTRRNLELLRAGGWRLLVSARGVMRTEGFEYAIDNGAWTAHQRGEPFDVAAFERVLELHGRGADWIVVPDIVGAGHRSLDFSLSWIDRLRTIGPTLLLAVQDGLREADVLPLLGPRVGLFLGGTTAWKLATMAAWGETAARAGCYYHVGRVNTARRIYQVRDAGAHSFDGTSASRYAAGFPGLDNARRQEGFRWPR